MDPWQQFLTEIEQYDDGTRDRLIGEGMRVLGAGMVLADDFGRRMRAVGEALSLPLASAPALSKKLSALAATQ